MAYRRKRTVKRQIRKRYGRRRTGLIKRVVKQQLNKAIEMKQRIYQHNAVGASVTGGAAVDFSAFSYGNGTIVAALSAGVANGTGEGQRVGNRITLKGCLVNLAFQPGDSYNNFRILLVTPKKTYDKTGVTGFTQQLLSNQGSSATQWLQPVDTDVFKVYWDKRYTLRYVPKDGNSANVLPQNRFLRKFIKLNKPIKWELSAPVSPTTDIFLVAISDSTVGLGTDPGTIAGHVKIWYQDA